MNDALVDFEASGMDLTHSYPIQVAWSEPDGSIESYYIRPVLEWTYWDNQAEVEAHGITREKLIKDGKPVVWIAERMNVALAGRVACWDGGKWDRFWCDRLFYAAGIERKFTIGEFRHPTLPPDVAARISIVARDQAGSAHDASNDVRYMLIVQTLAVRYAEEGVIP